MLYLLEQVFSSAPDSRQWKEKEDTLPCELFVIRSPDGVSNL